MSDKKTWEHYPHIWKTEASYLSWIRSNIRKIWKVSPQRNEFLRSKATKFHEKDSKGNLLYFKNNKPKIVKGYLCNHCGKECYEKTKISGFRKCYAVDHIVGNHSLTTIDQVSSFLQAMLCVSPDELQILCLDCHDIKTYSERYSCSLEEANLRKNIASLVKNKEDKSFFITRNLEVPKNLEKRKEGIYKILLKEQKNNE